MKKLIIFAIPIILLLSGCSLFEKSGNFQLYLTDDPIEGLENFYVTISGVSVKKDGEDGWIPLLEEGETLEYDLLQLIEKEDLMLDVELDDGTYVAIKIDVSGARLVIRDDTLNFTLDQSIEVIVHVNFTIVKGDTTEVTLDFQADESVQIEGDYYSFMPVITVDRVGY